MNKLLLLLLVAPVFGFGQLPFEIKGYVIFTGHELLYNGVQVPAGELYQLSGWYKTSADYNGVPESEFRNWEGVYYRNGNFVRDLSEDDMEYFRYIPFSITNTYHTEDIPGIKFTVIGEMGTMFNENTHFSLEDDGVYYYSSYEFIVYDVSQLSLAYNNSNEKIPTLYPNPTSSLLALNSDKEYDIEVYDMAGNKVMALTGNTIDMSHLSSATYIVKALDKVQNEEVSYKVVKN